LGELIFKRQGVVGFGEAVARTRVGKECFVVVRDRFAFQFEPTALDFFE
jgi:hypothetical protein